PKRCAARARRAGDAGKNGAARPAGDRHLVHDPERRDVARAGQAWAGAKDQLGVNFTTEAPEATEKKDSKSEGISHSRLPVKAGTHFSVLRATDGWIPAFAGKTVLPLRLCGA